MGPDASSSSLMVGQVFPLVLSSDFIESLDKVGPVEPRTTVIFHTSRPSKIRVFANVHSGTTLNFTRFCYCSAMEKKSKTFSLTLFGVGMILVGLSLMLAIVASQYAP